MPVVPVALLGVTNGGGGSKILKRAHVSVVTGSYQPCFLCPTETSSSSGYGLYLNVKSAFPLMATHS